MISRTAAPAELPLRLINAVAPIRICDNGGWTDTWFAGHGKIFNIGVSPSVEVQIAVYPRAEQRDHVVLYAENYGERFALFEPIPVYLSRCGLRVWESPLPQADLQSRQSLLP